MELKDKSSAELEQIISTTPDQQIKTEALIELAKKLYLSDAVRSYELGTTALAIARENQLTHLEGRALGVLANAQSYLGNIAEALRWNEQALTVYEQVGDAPNTALTLGNMGGNCWTLGEFSKAFQYLERAIAINTSLGATSTLGSNYLFITEVLRSLEQFDVAFDYLQKAEQVFREAGNAFGLARVNSSKGNLHVSVGNYAPALPCFESALAYYREAGNEKGVALVLSNMGSMYVSMNEFEKAIETYQASLELFGKHGMKQGSVSVHEGIGRSYLGLGNHSKALEHFRMSLQIATENNFLISVYEVHRHLSAIYEAQQDLASALMHYKQFHEMEMKVRDEDSKKNAAVLEVRSQLAEEEGTRKATERILHNILPKKIAERIRNGEEEIIERFEMCTVLFADMVGFTTWSETKTVDELAATLNRMFSIFDELAHRFGVEKIKTIGDAYMCVTGLPEPCADHAERMARMALAMNAAVHEAFPGSEIAIRIGIHSGEVVAGVIGKNKFAYDLWGDTVNMASRMESHGLANKIQVSETFRELLGGQFTFEQRGEIEVKGKGRLVTYFLQP